MNEMWRAVSRQLPLRRCARQGTAAKMMVASKTYVAPRRVSWKYHSTAISGSSSRTRRRLPLRSGQFSLPRRLCPACAGRSAAPANPNYGNVLMYGLYTIRSESSAGASVPISIVVGHVGSESAKTRRAATDNIALSGAYARACGRTSLRTRPAVWPAKVPCVAKCTTMTTALSKTTRLWSPWSAGFDQWLQRHTQ